MEGRLIDTSLRFERDSVSLCLPEGIIVDDEDSFVRVEEVEEEGRGEPSAKKTKKEERRGGRRRVRMSTTSLSRAVFALCSLDEGEKGTLSEAALEVAMEWMRQVRDEQSVEGYEWLKREFDRSPWGGQFGGFTGMIIGKYKGKSVEMFSVRPFLQRLRCGLPAHDAWVFMDVFPMCVNQTNLLTPLMEEVFEYSDDPAYMERIFHAVPDVHKSKVIPHLAIEGESSHLFQLFSANDPTFRPDQHSRFTRAGNVAAVDWFLRHGADPNAQIGSRFTTVLTNAASTRVALCLLRHGARYDEILTRPFLPRPRVLKAIALFDAEWKQRLIADESQWKKMSWTLEIVQMLRDCSIEIPRRIIDSWVGASRRTQSDPKVLEALGAFLSFGLLSEDSKALLPRDIPCEYVAWSPATHRYFRSNKDVRQRVWTALLVMQRLCRHFTRDMRHRILELALRRKIVL